MGHIQFSEVRGLVLSYSPTQFLTSSCAWQHLKLKINIINTQTVFQFLPPIKSTIGIVDQNFYFEQMVLKKHFEWSGQGHKEPMLLSKGTFFVQICCSARPNDSCQPKSAQKGLLCPESLRKAQILSLNKNSEVIKTQPMLADST